MNALTNTLAGPRDTRRKALSIPAPDHLNHSVTAVPALPARANRAQLVDCRLASLRVLAVTLLNEIEALESSDPSDVSELSLQTEVRRFEAELIRNALIRTGGRQRRAAKLLGMKITTLNTKIRRYNIEIG